MQPQFLDTEENVNLRDSKNNRKHEGIFKTQHYILCQKLQIYNTKHSSYPKVLTDYIYKGKEVTWFHTVSADLIKNSNRL